jgi:hypothetical protein
MSDGSGWGQQPEDTPGTWEYRQREDWELRTQAEMDEVDRKIGGSAPAADYPPAGSSGAVARTRRTPPFDKWALLTIPLGVIAVLLPIHGPHGHITGLPHFLIGVVIAFLGSPRARPFAIILAVILAAAAAWVWS